MTLYSPIKHLAHAIWFNHDPRHRYFVMLKAHTAYFDTAGSRNQGTMLTVSGCISSVKKWDEFDIHWGKILRKEGINEFHMTDFAKKEQEFNGEKWKKNDGHSERFFQKLVNAICKKVNYSPAIVVYLNDWHSMNEQFKLKESSYTPLAFGGVLFIQLIYEWCKKHNIPRNQVEFIYEYGDLDKGHLIDIAKKAYGIDLIPRSKQCKPLQASDLIAWLGNTAERDLLAKKNPRFSQSIQEIISRIEHDPWKCTTEALQGWCKDLHVPHR